MARGPLVSHGRICDLLFAVLCLLSPIPKFCSGKGFTLKGKNLLPREQKSFFLTSTTTSSVQLRDTSTRKGHLCQNGVLTRFCNETVIMMLNVELERIKN